MTIKSGKVEFRFDKTSAPRPVCRSLSADHSGTCYFDHTASARRNPPRERQVCRTIHFVTMSRRSDRCYVAEAKPINEGA